MSNKEKSLLDKAADLIGVGEGSSAASSSSANSNPVVQALEPATKFFKESNALINKCHKPDAKGASTKRFLILSIVP